MERGSDKHGPRIDENLERDTESITRGAPVEARADGGREQEGPAEGEPTPDSLVSGDVHPGGPDDLTHDEVEGRAELARFLKPSVWPAGRDDLVACARALNAPPELVEALASLPEGTFTHTEAVWEALGGRVEFRG